MNVSRDRARQQVAGYQLELPLESACHGAIGEGGTGPEAYAAQQLSPAADKKRALTQDLMERLGEWMRRKLRCVILKRLKRAKPMAKFLMKLGVPARQAWALASSGKGWWRKAGSPSAQHAMNNTWFAKQKLINPVQWYETFKNDRNRRGTEQVCPVV